MEQEGNKAPEKEPQSYYLASRFHTREEAAVPYYAVQETLRTTDCDLSAFRFRRQWKEPNDKPWYVLVIGEKPAEEVEQQLSTALSLGETARVPEEALEFFLLRRITEAVKGPWVEEHYKEGLQVTQIKFSRKPKGKGHRRRKH